MLRALACAAAACLSACTAGSGGQLDAGGPASCSGDAECPSGFRCDRAERRCVCTGDQACPGGFCNAFTGACVASVPGCHDDSACARGEFCDRAVRSCRPVTGLCGECKADAQCGAGSRCAAHPQYPQFGTFCVPQCVSGGCAGGLRCLDQLCYPSQGACGVSNACTPDSRRPCSADADCADRSQACDATLGSCVTKVNTCPAGDACDPQQRICVHACSVDDDCLQIEGAPGYRCVASACVKQSLCDADAQCGDGQICRANADGSKTCAQGCEANGDCPLGQSCDKGDPRHPKCAQGCTANGDCPLNAVCSAGACKNALSGSEGSCSQTCQATDACPVASACGNNCCNAANLPQTCSKTYGPTSVACPQCTTNGVCPPGCDVGCYPMAFKACTTQSECDQQFPGTFCTAARVCQAMLHLQSCTDDASCPWRGFKCVDRSQSCGAGAGGRICVPQITPAKVACVQGHL